MSMPVPSSSRSPALRSEPDLEVEAARARPREAKQQHEHFERLRGEIHGLRLPKAPRSRGNWDLPRPNDWEARARRLFDDWQLRRETRAALRKARELDAPDALAALHERIEKRFQAWLDGPQDHPDPEIAALDRQAAAIIRARTQAALAPLEASIEAARLRAIELLAK